MGLRDLFGTKNRAAEQEKIIEEQKEKDHESVIEKQKKAHEGMAWPGVPRLNILNIKGNSQEVEDPLTPERKDEIGPLIFDPDLKADMVKDLSVQELLFLELAQAVFNRKEPLQNYEKNRRVIYNAFLNYIHNAEKFYVLYDRRTGYPLIDGGFVPVYLDQEMADKAVELYKAQFRDTVVQVRPGEAAPADENGQKQMALFDFLYYLGAENIIVDNGWYKGVVRRSEISAPMDWNSDPKNTPPSNPSLAFAMTDYVSEMRWPVKYEKREEVIKRKTDRMMTLIPLGRYIVPSRVSDVDPAVGAAHPGPDGKPAQRQVQFPAIKVKDKMYLPLFTDLFEYSRRFGKSDMKPVGFEYRNLIQFLNGPMEGFLINPSGQGILVPKEKAVSLLAAVSRPAAGKAAGKNPAAAPAAQAGEKASAGNSIDSAGAKADSGAEESAPDGTNTNHTNQ